MMSAAELNSIVFRSRKCSGCPLEGRSFVGMDIVGNSSDLLFLGLNPGREEAVQGRPFVGKSGSFLRGCLAAAGIKNYVMVNSILCSTDNQRQIPDEDACRRFCKPNLALFVRHTVPKIVVPCGNGAAAVFGLGGMISVNCKKIFVSRGPSGRAVPTLVLPIKHPSALIRNGGKASPFYGEYMKRLCEIANFAGMVANGFDESLLEAAGYGYEMLFGVKKCPGTE